MYGVNGFGRVGMGFLNGKFHVIRPGERQGKGDFLSNTDPLHSFESLPG